MGQERARTARAVAVAVLGSLLIAGLAFFAARALFPLLGDRLMIVAGALFVIWPLTYWRSIDSIKRRQAERGADPEAFERHMDRGWIRVALWVAPVVGLVLIVMGLLA